MKKLFIVLMLLLAAALSSCLPQVQATSTALPTTASLPVAAETVAVPSGPQLLPDSGCTVVAKKSTPGATPESKYPPVSDTEHIKGPANAKVTIIEYSDFQ